MAGSISVRGIRKCLGFYTIIFTFALISNVNANAAEIKLRCDVPGLKSDGERYSIIAFDEQAGIVDGHHDGEVERDDNDPAHAPHYWVHITQATISWGWRADAPGWYAFNSIDRGTGVFTSKESFQRLRGTCAVAKAR